MPPPDFPAGALSERLSRLRAFAAAAAAGVEDARAVIMDATRAAQGVSTYDEAGEKTIFGGPKSEIGRY